MKPPASNRTTSAAAAHRIAPHADRLRDNVARFLASRGRAGATDEELAEGLRLKPSTLVPRRWELVRQGRVADSGGRRPTRSGAEAIVWVLAPQSVFPADDRFTRRGIAARLSPSTYGFPGAILCWFCRRWYERPVQLPREATSPHCGRVECAAKHDHYLPMIKEMFDAREALRRDA